MGTQSNQSNTSIKVSFEKSLNRTSLPLLQTQKEGYNIYFLLDTGAKKNYIRRDFLDILELNTDTEFLPDKEEFYGIDNVCHLTETCGFPFCIGDLQYVETVSGYRGRICVDFSNNEWRPLPCCRNIRNAVHDYV